MILPENELEILATMPDLVPSILPADAWRRKSNSGKIWKEQRRRLFLRDGFQCVRCRVVMHRWLEAHHLYGHGDEVARDEDVETRCPLCHAISHIGFSILQKRIHIFVSSVPQIMLNRFVMELALQKGVLLSPVKVCRIFGHSESDLLDDNELALVADILQENGDGEVFRGRNIRFLFDVEKFRFSNEIPKMERDIQC